MFSLKAVIGHKKVSELQGMRHHLAIQERLKKAFAHQTLVKNQDFERRVKDAKREMAGRGETQVAGMVGGKPIRPLKVPVLHLPDLDLRKGADVLG